MCMYGNAHITQNTPNISEYRMPACLDKKYADTHPSPAHGLAHVVPSENKGSQELIFKKPRRKKRVFNQKFTLKQARGPWIVKRREALAHAGQEAAEFSLSGVRIASNSIAIRDGQRLDVSRCVTHVIIPPVDATRT